MRNEFHKRHIHERYIHERYIHKSFENLTNLRRDHIHLEFV